MPHIFKRPRVLGPALLIALFMVMAIFAPWLAPFDPFKGGPNALLPPGTQQYGLGSDHLGRDVLSQLVYGARSSLLVGLLAAFSASLIGLTLGSVSGYASGWLDTVLMRVAEFFQTLPRFVLATIVVAVTGGGLLKIIIVIAVLGWMQTARVVRAQVLSLRNAGFVEAAVQMGASPTHILLRHIVPNVLGSVIVIASLDVAAAILLEGGLSFFGLGDPNLVSWGGMLNQAQAYLRQAWWLALFPGLAISLVVLAFNLLGDGLNEALNPR
ncbi:MAG: ABC transporter permease [Anaerolineae bacterium]|nr:ABC transporter permease [Anaerolineae bacterium]